MPALLLFIHFIASLFLLGVDVVLQHDNDAMAFSVTGGLLLAAQKLHNGI